MEYITVRSIKDILESLSAAKDASTVIDSTHSDATPTDLQKPEAQKTPRAHVLIIDDDLILLETMAEIIEVVHNTVAVTDATLALARIQAGEVFDAILCDLMMPNMDGSQFYESLKKISPQYCSRIVFLTGGSFTEKSDAFLSQTEINHIKKPVLTKDLFSAISQIISQRTKVKTRISS